MNSCAYCLEPFESTPGRSGPKRKYCNARCGVLHRRFGHTKTDRYCKCGQVLTQQQQKWCSNACSIRKWIERVCVCGSKFYKAHKSHTYCSVDCRPKRKWVNHGGSFKRRCEKYGVEYEAGIDKNSIAERIGTSCYVCNEEIDMTAVYPDALAATVEHIKPLSRGGGHIWGNVALSHFKCNCEKGVTIDDDSKANSGEET